MPVLTVYHHGLKGGVAPAPSDHERAKRRACSGWTARSTRSNLEFLRSVNIAELVGLGHTFTLTVRTCPESAAIWDRMRDAFVKRLRRGGLIRLHWVTEWQRRGVPHLHGVAYFADPGDDRREYARQDRLIRESWLQVVADYSAERQSQHVTPIEDALGWLKYLAKHAARGQNHYQRSHEAIPAQWQKATGRMWGKSGKWPVVAPVRLELSHAAWFRLRRLVRSYRIADARASGQPVRISLARRMLRAPSVERAETRGISEWIPDAVQFRLLSYLADAGHGIRC